MSFVLVVKRARARPGNSANSRAFAATGKRANRRAARSPDTDSSDGSVMALPHISAMRGRFIVVMAVGLGDGGRRRQTDNRQQRYQ